MRSSTRRASHRLIGAVTALACSATAGAGAIDEALALVPADAESALIIPHLKNASDELLLCLERAERAEALIAGRPLDIAKGQLGVGVGVFDNGSLVALVRTAKDVDADPSLVVLVPVNDPTAFLEGNFEPAPDGADGVVITTDGERLYSRVIGQHVALSPVAAGVEGLGALPERATAIRARFGETGADLMRSADVLAWFTDVGAERATRTALAQAERAAAEGAMEVDPGIMRRVQRWSALGDGLDVAVLTVDFDPLGVMSRGVIRSKPGSELATMLAGGDQPAVTPLGRLPENPFYVAFSADIRALGGWPVFERLVGEGWSAPEWMRSATGVQSAVYPSKLGVAIGGVLNDASLVLTGDSGSLRSAMKAWFMSLASDSENVRRTPVWTDDQALRGGGEADAFELKETVKPGAPQAGRLMPWNLARSTLFGNRGIHGLARTVPGALVVTFSQRPDVLSRAVDAASGGATLADSPVVAAMRGFMLGSADVEFFLGIGTLEKLRKQLAGMFPGGNDAMPPIDPSTEPIGVAMDVEGGELRSAVVVPSGVVGLMLDGLEERVRRGMQP